MSDPFGSGESGRGEQKAQGTPPGAGGDPAEQPGWGEPQRDGARDADWGTQGPPSWDAPDTADGEASRGGTGGSTALPPQEPASGPGPGDPNVEAIERADLDARWSDWLHEVARQVDPRLDRVNPQWRSSPQAAAAQACAFGLLLGQLGSTYPHARGVLGRVAEIHESFGNLPAGERLSTLEGLSRDGQRATAWIGPLVGAEDQSQVRRLFD